MDLEKVFEDIKLKVRPFIDVIIGSAKKKANEYKIEVYSELKEEIKIAFRAEKQSLFGNIERIIIATLKESILNPIEEALKEAKKVQDEANIDKVLEKVRKEKEEIEQKIEQIKSAQNYLKKELEKIQYKGG